MFKRQIFVFFFFFHFPKTHFAIRVCFILFTLFLEYVMHVPVILSLLVSHLRTISRSSYSSISGTTLPAHTFSSRVVHRNMNVLKPPVKVCVFYFVYDTSSYTYAYCSCTLNSVYRYVYKYIYILFRTHQKR